MLPENWKNKKKISRFPRHVAIIMDGNGRWAKIRGKFRIFGHKAGIKSVYHAVSFAINHHFDALTLYAFSSENWNRPSKEVYALMDLFTKALDTKISTLHKNNIKLRVIGDISRFSIRLQEKIHYAESLTNNNNGLALNIAANYGGRWDITQGVRKIATKVQEGILNTSEINEDSLSQVMCMSELSPVDFVIRTGGECRISNFLLWQIAYAELFFTDVLWPDFNDIIFNKALDVFIQRERRFGRTIINDNSVPL